MIQVLGSYQCVCIHINFLPHSSASDGVVLEQGTENSRTVRFENRAGNNIFVRFKHIAVLAGRRHHHDGQIIPSSSFIIRAASYPFISGM